MVPPLHPLSALREDEIRLVANVTRRRYGSSMRLQFKGITLHEPSRSEIRQFRERGTAPARKAWVNYYQKGTTLFHEAVINLDTKSIEKHRRVAEGFHGCVDENELLEIEQLVLSDLTVRAEMAKLKLPPSTVFICDPWTWGPDENDNNQRLFQCYMYMRDPGNPTEADSNHYAFPLAFSPVVDATKMKVIGIKYIPTGSGFETAPTTPARHIKPNEYVPDLIEPRKDLKDLNVIQPDGASFRTEGDIIDWQKWQFRATTNYREGMVLHEISFDGRPLFYRIALSDMTIPYADPRSPVNRKQAFDLGDAGAGVMANNLRLGCDCLGAIAYKDGLISDSDGNPLRKPNSVCIHEQDAGILWKHTNYRTNRAVVTRKRELVLQQILTVANYEYILAFIFNQAGELEYEVRATGILSTQPIDQGVSVDFGTVVHDGVLACHHQHIFSLRIDPELDGDFRNKLVYHEAVPIPRDPKTNPMGNGYVSTRTEVNVSGGYDLNTSTGRVYLIENSRVQNPINGANVAYKIMVPPMQPLLASPDSLQHIRADFGDHSIYVTKPPSGPSTLEDPELFAGGQYTTQNKKATGVRKWASRKDDISDSDIVLWVQFGLQHLPRIEDFPVMPTETLRVSLKPVNFFERNPSMDVPASRQECNRSQALPKI